MTRLLTATAFLALIAGAASADSFPVHKQSGFRDLPGCDAATRKVVTNAAGDELYVLMQCPGKLPGNRTADIAEAKAREEARENDAPAS